MGKQSCIGGMLGACQGAIEPDTEVCDAEMLDENCDGTSNEGCTCTPRETKPCGAQGLCAKGTQTCGADGAWGKDCSIAAQPEICDGVADEDCDGRVDNGCECTNGKSEECAMGGEGVCNAGTRQCANGKWGACASKVAKSREQCDGLDNDCDGMVDNNACSGGLKCSNGKCVECASDTDCKGSKCLNTGTCCVPDCGKQCGGTESNCGTTCTVASCARGEMCANDTCIAETRTCIADSSLTCGVFGANCENRATVSGTRFDLCRWSQRPGACEAAGGLWTTANTTFAKNCPGCIPDGADGACLSDVTNLTCDPSEISKCRSVGATCDQQKDTSGNRKDMCRWDNIRSQQSCASPGLWTEANSAFTAIWPQSVPPGRPGACITQVANLP